MTNWEIINQCRVRDGIFRTKDEDGLNGMFLLTINNVPIRVICSDGGGWKHVSVTIHSSRIPPSWAIMCKVKELFLGDDVWAMQLHPPKDKNISNHDGCLHLWIPDDGNIPTPPPDSVGVEGLKMDDITPEKALRIYVKANMKGEGDA